MATKNLTIRLSDQLIEASKEYAQKQGKTLNEMIREFLENNIKKPKEYETPVDKWVTFARENPAPYKGHKFDREDANDG